MSNWIKTLDGRLVNMRNIFIIYQDENTVEVCYFDGERDGEKFKDELTAISVFVEIQKQLSCDFHLIDIPQIVQEIEERPDKINGGER